MFKQVRSSFLILFISAVAINSYAQNLTSSDDLLKAGQLALSQQKDFPKAISLLRQAYLISPNYTDVKILLGRAYQLNNNVDSARYFYNEARLTAGNNPDLLNYMIGLEYNAGNIEAAVSYLDIGLNYNPQSEDLLIKKASMLYEKKEYQKSQLVLNQLLKINPKNENAKQLANQVNMVTASNSVSVNYDFTHFDNLFEPWHATSLAYQRTTGLGSISGRVTYVNRSNGLSGYQYELESYPKVSKTVYGNFAVALSNGDPVFPKFTARGALYKAIGSFELEGGLRYVGTPDENFFIYNAGISKYVSSFLFNFKSYLLDFNKSTGQGFQLSARYYFSENANNVFIVGAGSGVAPDLTNRNLGIANVGSLSAKRLFAEYRCVVKSKNILSLLATMGNEDYTATKSANQYNIGFGLVRKF